MFYDDTGQKLKQQTANQNQSSEVFIKYLLLFTWFPLHKAKLAQTIMKQATAAINSTNQYPTISYLVFV